jgi:hypothetical protein
LPLGQDKMASLWWLTVYLQFWVPWDIDALLVLPTKCPCIFQKVVIKYQY